MRLKFLLRPGWLGLILLVVVFAALCFTVLAPWQFSRNEQNQARNDAIAESFHSSPKPLRDALDPGERPDQSTEWQQVRLRGTYLPNGERLAWQRTVQGEPAFEVLTPFRLQDGTVLLVDRGYLRPVEGTHAPKYDAPPRGEVTLTARIRADEKDSENRPAFEHDGQRWVYAINSGTVAADANLPIRPGYFALNDDQPGALAPLPLPQLDSGPYFSYALQWIAFGSMAILGIGYLVYTETIANPRHDAARAGPADRERTAPEPVAPTGTGAMTTATEASGSVEHARTPQRHHSAQGPKRRESRKRAVARAIAEEEAQEQADRQQSESAGHARSDDE